MTRRTHLSLIQAIPDNARPIVVGRREGMAGTHVPWTSRFGRKFSNFWVFLSGGPRITDSQSGFRIYPLPEAMGLNVTAKRYQFEVEILVKARWRKIPVIEAPIRVSYAPGKERISHFRPFIDFVRNTIRVCKADLPENRDACKIEMGEEGAVNLNLTPNENIFISSDCLSVKNNGNMGFCRVCLDRFHGFFHALSPGGWIPASGFTGRFIRRKTGLPMWGAPGVNFTILPMFSSIGSCCRNLTIFTIRPKGWIAWSRCCKKKAAPSS